MSLEKRHQLVKLPPEDHARAKLQHAAVTLPVDVGLFGNSRILMISKDHIGTQNGRVFNYAVGGQSFRQSVRMLKALSEMGRAPRIAVISFDHSELGLPGNDPVIPNLAGRISERFSEFFFLFPSHGFKLKDRLVFLNNAVRDELSRLRSALNIKILIARVQLYFAYPGANRGLSIAAMAATKTSVGQKNEVFPISFLEDGSMAQKLPTTKLQHNMISNMRQDRYPLLEADLQTLNMIASEGTQIFIYESPLAPEVLKKTEKDLSANALFVRTRMIESCGKLNLSCFGAPMLNGRSRGVFWPDNTHAPAILLGNWITKIIRKPAYLAQKN